jgi:hypothetical protein
MYKGSAHKHLEVRRPVDQQADNKGIDVVLMVTIMLDVKVAVMVTSKRVVKMLVMGISKVNVVRVALIQY